MKLIKKLAIGLFVLLLLAIIGIWFAVRMIQGPGVEERESDLRFTKTALGYTHASDLNAELPFMGVAAVDVDGDGIDEVFFGSGGETADAIYGYKDGSMQALNIKGLEKSGDATFGAASIDTDGDGREELFVCRESGVYFFRNTPGGFVPRKIDLDIATNTTPLSVALGDINRDGKVDIYVSGYIRFDMVEGETNFDKTYGGWSYLLLNKGDDTWTDISGPSGVGRKHNTFLAMFIDMDHDRWPDLVVAQDTGVVETWRNKGDNTFEAVDNGCVSSYPMGIAAGDLDNDGDVDLYFSNVGTTLPETMLRGNLPKDAPFNMDYMLFENDGFTFKDSAIQRNAAKYGFGWGAVAADFNNDTMMDLYFAQNYARFPGVKFLELYPGRLLQQWPDGTFWSVERAAGIRNQAFGITQVVSDFNRDGWPDMVIGNLNDEAQLCVNKGGDNNWLTVALPSTPEWLNTRVEVQLEDGPKLTRQLFASEGLCSDQADELFFGLGANDKITSVTIMPLNGKDRTIESPKPNQILEVN